MLMHYGIFLCDIGEKGAFKTVWPYEMGLCGYQFVIVKFFCPA